MLRLFGTRRASDDRYFSRAATWHLMDEHVVVHDSFSKLAPRMITMEPWHEVVFSAADGEHTIAEFVRQLGTQYGARPPKGLHKQVLGIIRVLEAEGIVRVHDAPKPLPPYFAEEFSQQPPAVRKAQMEADGLLRSDRPKTPGT